MSDRREVTLQFAGGNGHKTEPEEAIDEHPAIVEIKATQRRHGTMLLEIQGELHVLRRAIATLGPQLDRIEAAVRGGK